MRFAGNPVLSSGTRNPIQNLRCVGRMDTFSQISENAGPERITPLSDGSLRPPPEMHKELFGPGENGWLKACRAWIQEGRTDDPCQYHACLARIIKGVDEFFGEVAELHLLVLRMAGCARQLLQVKGPVHSEHRTCLEQTLLDRACRVLQPDSAENPASWEEARDLGDSVVADTPTSLIRKALTIAAARVGLVGPDQAPYTWHLRRVGWLCDLADYLLTDDPSQTDRQVRSPFVLVTQKGEVPKEGEAHVVEFMFEIIPGEGAGEVFIAPEQAFMRFGNGFDTVFGETAEVAAGLIKKDHQALADIRVKIHTVDDQSNQWYWHGIGQKLIEGPSATGAAVRGLHAAWSVPARVCDRAVVCLCAVDRHARVGAVKDLIKKVKAVVDSGLFDTVVVADANSERIARNASKGSDVRVQKVETLEDLIGIRSALTEEVLVYLKNLAKKSAELPKYYPEHLREESVTTTPFDNLRQTVQVVTNRGRFDQWLAQERERLVREGFDPDSIAYSPRRGMPEKEEEGDRQPEVEVETLDWDERAGKRFMRAVILGDPGFGKSWLLRYEARRLARKAIEALEQNSQAISDILLPVFRRLSDLASPDNALEEVLLGLLKEEHSEAFCSFVRSKLSTDGCVLLLDAWDEVSDKPSLKKRVETFARRFIRPRILLTSRIVGYETTLPPLPNAKELELLAFDWRRIESFTRVWFGQYKEAGDAFLGKLERHRQVKGLARIPLMLSLICRVCPEGNFPDRRGQLYEQCLRGLLGDWRKDDEKPGGMKVSAAYTDALMDALGYVSLELFKNHQEQFTESSLRKILILWLDGLKTSHELHGANVGSLIQRFKNDGILVTARSHEDAPLLFLHRTFQEYLAVRALAGESDAITTALKHTYDPEWHQVLVLLAGLLDPRQALRYLAAVLDKNSEDLLCRPFLLGLELAGQVTREGPACQAWTILAQEAVDIVLGNRVQLAYLAGRASSGLAYLPEAVKPLVDALSDGDSGIRRTAAAALGEIHSDLAAQSLMQALGDKYVGVRWAASRSLGAIGSNIAADLLKDALGHDDSGVRRAAAAGLGLIGPGRAVDALVDALRDENCSVAMTAAEVLGSIQSDQAIELLIGALRHDDSGVRRAAASALGAIGSCQAFDALVYTLHDEDQFVAMTAATAIGDICLDSAMESAVVALLRHNDPRVREAAAIALGRMHSNSAAGPLTDALRDRDEDSCVREAAAAALGGMHSDLAAGLLTDALRDRDEDSCVREAAATALGLTRADQALKPLIESLSDKDPGVRRCAAAALGGLHSDLATVSLTDALRDKDSRVREAAAIALGGIHSNLAAGPLTDALRDEDSCVREAAATALGAMCSDLAAQGLIVALGDEDPSVRRAAAQALGAIGSDRADRAVQPLTVALADDDSGVQRRAAEALRAVVPLDPIKPVSLPSDLAQLHIRLIAARDLLVTAASTVPC